mmetsp:Transcript_19894/g.67795  ORF Transcript_19894/g.67795 Transcript_19894/m.67795 type:complete len:202 (+) Transcript_19894:2-607(+)
MPPLDAPPQPRAHEWLPYREGAVVADTGRADGLSCWVDVGLGEGREAKVGTALAPGTRVTVSLGKKEPKAGAQLEGSVVSPAEPRERQGMYWGYTVRVARSLSEALTGCPWEEGYDVTVGTSEHGDDLRGGELGGASHALVAFGGLSGLEAAAEGDGDLQVKNPRFLFDRYVNVCPKQGSRTIRTEEAVMIALTALRAAER